MTSLGFGIIMFVCIIPILWIFFFLIYPKNTDGHKYIFGVMNREEFKEEQAVADIRSIVNSTRALALKVMIVCTIVSFGLLFFHSMTIKTALWLSFTYLSLTAIMLPYILAHKSMMELKRKLNITANRGISYVDLKVAKGLRTLKPIKVILPNVIGLIAFVFSLLVDLKIISLSGVTAVSGSFLTSIISGTMLIMGVIIAVLAIYIDNMTNETISPDTDINANYNRAKKRTKSVFFVSFVWINLFFILAVNSLLFIKYSDIIAIIIVFIYMIMLIASMVVFYRNNNRLDKRYLSDITLFTDDDEYWIGGLIYYNPSDKRVLVESRFANGSTINLAGTFGKAITVILALSILVSIAVIVWSGLLESTPVDLRLDGDNIICHQLRDEYIIPVNRIKSVEYGDDITDKEMVRINGVGMDSLLKGNFIVDDEKGCRLFLNPKVKAYIHIRTDDGTSYYIAGSTKEETKDFYNLLIMDAE